MAATGADKVIIFDMDSTLIQIECIDEIASLTEAGAKVAAITDRAMRGELDFEQSLRQRVACLKGIREAEFESIFTPIPLTRGADLLINTLQGQGWRTVLVSGGFTWFAERVATQLKLHEFYANTLECSQGILTGTVSGTVVDAETKAAHVRRLKQHVAGIDGTVVAVGDGANDIAMLTAADIGVAFCAKPALRAVADICIDEPDLSQLLLHLKQRRLVT